MSDMLSVSEAASSMGVSERTIWRWLRSGRLSAERSGGRVLIRMPPGQPRQTGHSLGESRAIYGAPDIARFGEPGPGPWPYTPENLEKRRVILLAKRRRAAERMAVLGRETRPDPDGLTGVDYIREFRGPIGPEIDDDLERTPPSRP